MGPSDGENGDPLLDDEAGACNLRWVHDAAGVVRHVSEFAGTPVGHRPRVTCVGCREPLTLRLGTILAHHAAHKTSSRCPMSTPEGAAHLNTKLALARGFSHGTAVLVRLPCAGVADELDADLYPAAFGCGRGTRRTCWLHDTQPWLTGWDEVRTEVPVGGRVADVAFLRAGRVVGVVEVFRRHAVREEKAADYAAAGVPWLEVAADPRAGERTAGWDPRQPLEPIAFGPWRNADVFRCVRHAAEVADRREARRHVRGLLAARLVDLYGAEGLHRRELVPVLGHEIDGQVRRVACAFVFDAAPLGAGATLDPASRAHQWYAIPDRVRSGADLLAYLDEQLRFRFGCAPAGAWFDSPMDWATGADGTALAREYERMRLTDPAAPALYEAFPVRAEWHQDPPPGRWDVAPEYDAARWTQAADYFGRYSRHPAYAARNARRVAERNAAAQRQREEREAAPLRAWLEIVDRALAELPLVGFGGGRVHALDQDGIRGRERLVFVPVPDAHLHLAAKAMRARGERFVSVEPKGRFTRAGFVADVEAAQDPAFYLPHLRAVAVTRDLPPADDVPTLVLRTVPLRRPEVRLGREPVFRRAVDVVRDLASGRLRWRENARPGATVVVRVATTLVVCPQCRRHSAVQHVARLGFIAACGSLITGHAPPAVGGPLDLLGFSLALAPHVVGDLVREYRAGRGGELVAEAGAPFAQHDLPLPPAPSLFGPDGATDHPDAGQRPDPVRCPACRIGFPTAALFETLRRPAFDEEAFRQPATEWRGDTPPVRAPHWCESDGVGCDDAGRNIAGDGAEGDDRAA